MIAKEVWARVWSRPSPDTYICWSFRAATELSLQPMYKSRCGMVNYNLYGFVQ